jgi:hypothetical protein
MYVTSGQSFLSYKDLAEIDIYPTYKYIRNDKLWLSKLFNKWT